MPRAAHSKFANCSLPRRAAGGCDTAPGNPGPPPQPDQCWGISSWSIPLPAAVGMAPSTPRAGSGRGEAARPCGWGPLQPPCAPQNTCTAERMFTTIYLQPSPCPQLALLPARLSCCPYPGACPSCGATLTPQAAAFRWWLWSHPWDDENQESFPQGEGVPRALRPAGRLASVPGRCGLPRAGTPGPAGWARGAAGRGLGSVEAPAPFPVGFGLGWASPGPQESLRIVATSSQPCTGLGILDVETGTRRLGD